MKLTRPTILRPVLVLSLAALAATGAAARREPVPRPNRTAPGAPQPDAAAPAQPTPPALSVQVEPQPEPVAPPRDHDPAALALLDEAEAAIAALTSFRATMRAQGTSVFKGTSDEGSAVILGQRSEDDPARWLVRITGPVTPERERDPIDLDATFDGLRMRWIDRDDRRVGARVLPVRMPEAWFAVPDRFRSRLWINPNPFANERSAERLTVQDRQTIEGVECDAVRADMAGGTTYFIAYLGADDHLPRRLVRGFDSRSSSLPMAGTETIDYLSLTTDPELSDDAFLLATPEGYTEERFPDQVRIPANLPGSISVPTPGSEGDGEGGTPEPGGDGSVIATASSFVPTAGVAREMALEFDLKDDQGKPIRLSDLRGKLVLVLFWSSWSPWASDLARELRPIREANPDLQVLVLAVRERSPETMRQRFDALRLPATLLAGADDVAARYEVGAVPSLVLVGTQGEILLRHSGFDPQHSPITELRSLIANQ